MSEARPLKEIAAEIIVNWDPPNYAAAPYLEAMLSLDKITDSYYADDGKTVVLYFLSNAGTWRGDVARRVKVELKALTK